jgi:ATP/maltotriose-dependent transcriptional regulator MalT
VLSGLDLIWGSGRLLKVRPLGGLGQVMAESDVRQRDGRSQRAAGSAFVPVAPKLHRPLIRPGTVRRSSLIERLARSGPCPVVSVVAPAGYGKTTLLSQWAERNGPAFAWVSVDEADNDPKVLLSYVAAALDGIEPIDERVFDALASPVSSVPGSVVPRLGSAFSSMTSPVVLVLDDVHVLRNFECRSALSVLADHVPDGSQLAFAGRAPPPPRIARLRAEGKITEIGTDDLSLTRDEASSLLRNVGLALAEDDVAELYERTEGWPAGLYLAALYLREGGPLATAASSFGGDDRLVSDYLESEFLSRISRQQRAFLTRTAVLERMCGPLCEAVLEASGSAAVLADLAGANLLLVPLEERGGIEGHPMAAALGSFFSALTGSPVDAERWADSVDRWQYGDPARPDDPSAEAWAIMVRAVLCRRGVERMRADADEAVRRFAAGSFLTPTPALMQGIARVLCRDLDGGDASLEDAVSIGEQVGSPEDVAVAWCERALVAMARSQWDRAGALAGQARAVLRRAGIEESFATPLICALRARAAMHRGDAPAARRELLSAQPLRPLLTFALPHLAVQARLELARVHLALADPAGARTIMREVDDLLRRRPGLGTLAGEARAVRAQLSRDRGSSVPGASALTAAELRLLPLLSTHLSFPQIAEEMFLSRHTIKSQAMSIYRKLGAPSRSQAVAQSRELGLLEG